MPNIRKLLNRLIALFNIYRFARPRQYRKQFKLYLHPHDPDITKFIARFGTWEEFQTDLLLDLVNPGTFAVDIGANIGTYTIPLAHKVGATGKIYAFEPEPTNHSILLRNISLNNLTNIVVEQKALAQEAGTIELNLSQERSGSHSLLSTKHTGAHSISVPCVTFDTYFEDKLSLIRLIKIDVEGAEWLVLQGMQKFFQARHAVTILMEFSPCILKENQCNPKQVLELARDSGFGITVLDRDRKELLQALTDQQILELCAQGPYKGRYLELMLSRPGALGEQ